MSTIPGKMPPAQEQQTKGEGSKTETKTRDGGGGEVIATISLGPSGVVVRPVPSGGGEEGGGVVVGGETVRPGEVVTRGGVPVAVRTSSGGMEVIVGTKTVGIPAYAPPLATITPGSGPPIPIRPLPNGYFLVGTSTLEPNKLISLSSTPLLISTNPTTSFLHFGTLSLPLLPSPKDPPQNQPPIPLPLSLSLSSLTLTPLLPFFAPPSPILLPTGYVVEGYTLHPGDPPLTLGGEVLEMVDPTRVVVDGRTETLTPTYVYGGSATVGQQGMYTVGTTLVGGAPGVVVLGGYTSGMGGVARTEMVTGVRETGGVGVPGRQESSEGRLGVGVWVLFWVFVVGVMGVW